MKHKVVLAIVAFLGLSSVSFGWGPEGHRIVTLIAEGYLTPKTRAAVADLLDKATITDFATWADSARAKPEYAWSKKLHGATVTGDDGVFRLERDCADGCAVSAIVKFTAVLEKPGVDRKTRVEALKFLVHFASDVHQPIHVSSVRQLKGQPADLEFFSQPAKLHAVWDALLIRHTGKAPEAYANELRRKITPQQFAKWSAIKDPAVWANESQDLSTRFVYDLPKDGKIGQAYFDRCIPVVDERLSMAGVRLATRLNSIFDPQEPAHPTTTTAPSTGAR